MERHRPKGDIHVAREERSRSTPRFVPERSIPRRLRRARAQHELSPFGKQSRWTTRAGAGICRTRPASRWSILSASIIVGAAAAQVDCALAPAAAAIDSTTSGRSRRTESSRVPQSRVPRRGSVPSYPTRSCSWWWPPRVAASQHRAHHACCRSGRFPPSS
jgi:hypothetical protein